MFTPLTREEIQAMILSEQETAEFREKGEKFTYNDPLGGSVSGFFKDGRIMVDKIAVDRNHKER